MFAFENIYCERNRQLRKGDRMKKIILLLLAFVLVACSMGTKSAFDTHHEKWQDANIDHYRYSILISCFCPGTEKMPLNIEVQNGEVVSMAYVDGTSVSAEDPQFEFYSRYSTIDRLFSELKADLEGAADEVTVTYNSSVGYPDQINIDRIKDAVDDETSLMISEFEMLE